MKTHRIGSALHRLIQKSAHLATGTTIPYISVYQPFFHQDNTNHLQISNMFAQSLSHMFPRPMCQKTEQLPIKVLLKFSECQTDCLTWCDTIATQESPSSLHSEGPQKSLTKHRKFVQPQQRGGCGDTNKRK